MRAIQQFGRVGAYQSYAKISQEHWQRSDFANKQFEILEIRILLYYLNESILLPQKRIHTEKENIKLNNPPNHNTQYNREQQQQNRNKLPPTSSEKYNYRG